MKTRHMKNMDQKIEELKSYFEERFCCRDKKLGEICENLSVENKLSYNSQMTSKNKVKE